VKAEELYKPVGSRPSRPPGRRLYMLGGVFCTTLAAASVVLDLGWAGAVVFGGLAVGSFRLALRRERGTVVDARDA